MIILGLTGSIGMGKSSVLKILRTSYRLPVWDADHVARTLLATNKWVIRQLNDFFPEVIMDGRVDRMRLRDLTFRDLDRLHELEEILHPILRDKAIQFVARMQRESHAICVLEVPLLFETGWDEFCTHTIVAFAPAFIQEARVLRRIGMTWEHLEHVREVQIPTSEKLKLATFPINTGASRGFTAKQIRDIMTSLRED